MKYFKSIKIIILVLSLLVCSCAKNVKPIEFYYSVPTVSYLRECPAYDCQVVTTIFNADKVKVLEKNDAGWWHVQSALDQKIGWTQRDLLSEIPLITQKYYVAADQLPLRDSPNEDVVSRKLLGYGEAVQKIDEKDDWWRVLVEKDKSLGWIPAKMASATRLESLENSAKADAGALETPGSSKPAYFFVAAAKLTLYLIPSIPSQVVKVLELNDQVAKISQADSGWVKIRYIQTGAEGWTLARYLKDTPVTQKNQMVIDRKKSPKKRSSPGQPIPPPDSESLEPEGM
jgi:uncharacterized protein YgiM (DUF1202 family)